MDFENTEQKLIVKCHRDRRFKSLDPETGTVASINRYVRRQVQDLPIAGYPCVIDFELAQVRIDDSKRLVEHCDFVAKGSRYTRRFCQMISGLCRHMSIQTVSKHLKIRWETVKNIDKDILAQSLPALDPTQLKDLTLIGVDEVARAKGHDYMTVVYDMVSGQLIWVEHGRTADVLITFLNQLPEQTANGIKAVAMDMGKAYQKAVRTALPNADIVFDRFHVMQNFSKVIQRQRRTEFRKATDHNEKGLIKGSLYLLLMNAEKMSDKQSDKLDDLLEVNKSLCTLYMMKEQLQALWSAPSFESMDNQLEAWCQLADSTNLFALQDFAKSLRAHREGICNYAKYRLTSARIEAGNVAIGMIRKRARGIKDTNYFKLKIRQTSVKETHSIFYPNVKLT
jgi:transposase